MTKQERDDSMFIEMASTLALRSNCVSKKVGCLIVKDGRIIVMGYNGTPKGYLNCCDRFPHSDWEREDHHAWSNTYEVHAEMNAILFAARHGISIDGTTLYSTLQPCAQCTKNLIGAGIIRIVYRDEYDKVASGTRDLSDFLEAMGIVYHQLPTSS